MGAVQKRNAQLIQLLRQTFLRLSDPARTIRSADNVSNPPTDAELDSAFDVPANLPSQFIGIVDDAGAGTNVYLVWTNNGEWFHALGTKAL